MPPGTLRQFGRTVLMRERFKAGDVEGARELAGQIGWHVEAEWFPGFERTLAANGSSSSISWSGEDPGHTLNNLITRIAAEDPKGASAILLLPPYNEDLTKTAAAANPAGLAATLAAQFQEIHRAMNDPLPGTPADDDRGKKGVLMLNACHDAIRAWAEHDQAAAAAWVAAQPAAINEVADYTAPLLETWVKTDPAAMLAWATSRDAAALELAWEKIVSKDPSFALSRLDTFFESASPENMAYLLINPATGPDAARTVMQRMPDDTDVSLSRAMQPWLHENPEEASTWVTALPAGAKRDRAANELAVWYYSTQDYEASLTWALTLPAEARENFMAMALDTIRSEDPAKSEALIRKSSLPPEEKELYLHPPDSEP
jgi:hypothetical protein